MKPQGSPDRPQSVARDYGPARLKKTRQESAMGMAVIHRDIKPENMVRTPEGWVLIDFGSSRQSALGGGHVSVIGTTGYAAPEQFFGQALPASDQYGLAATVLHLATHRHPTEFPLKKLKLEIDDAGLSQRMKNVLGRMLSPDPKERFQDAESALKGLRSGSGIQEWQLALAPLAETETILKTTAHNDALEIEIGPRYHKRIIFFALVSLMISISIAMVRVYQGMILTQWIGTWSNVIMFFGIFVVPQLRREWLGSKTTRLMLTPESWRLEWDGKVVSEGTSPPKILLETGLGGLSVKLRDVDQVSPPLGHSLNPAERQALKEIVAAYSRPHLPEPAPRVVEESQAMTVRTTDLQVTGRRPTRLRWFSSLCQSHRVLPSTPKREAYFRRISESDRALFEHHGFKHAGFIKESVFWVVGPEKEVLFNVDGTIALHMKPGGYATSDNSRDTKYYMASLMSDGRHRLTGLTGPTEDLVYTVPSKGDFETDLESHRAWIIEQVEAHNSLPMQMTSIEDRVATLRHYVLHAEPKSLSLLVFGTASMLFFLVVLLVVLPAAI